MERLALLASCDLRRQCPGLIHGSITGFGSDLPLQRPAAYDSVGLALSGSASRSPIRTSRRSSGPTIPDNATDVRRHGVRRRRTPACTDSPEGRRVEVNMLEAAISFIPDPFANHTQMGIANDPLTRVAKFTFRSRFRSCRRPLLCGASILAAEVLGGIACRAGTAVSCR